MSRTKTQDVSSSTLKVRAAPWLYMSPAMPYADYHSVSFPFPPSSRTWQCAC